MSSSSSLSAAAISPNGGGTSPSTPNATVTGGGGAPAPFLKDMLGYLCKSGQDPTPALTEALTDLCDMWGITSFTDWGVFTSKDIEDYCSGLQDPNHPLKPPQVHKRLGYLVNYAKVSEELDPTTPMNEIVKAVLASSSKESVPANPSSSQSLAEYKKTVPDLEAFSGRDEDYYAWKESTVNTLGQGGLSDYITLPSFASRTPQIAQSVFYAMRSALQDGTASHLCRALYDKKDLDPFKLMESIDKYYDTPVNKANVVLHQVRKLLSLRLDADTTPLQFISAWQECIQKLTKENAKLASDADTLRALLLEAIQDDEYDTIRDKIISDPTKPIDSILDDLRNRDASLQIKDNARTTDALTRTGRRVQFDKKTKSYDGDKGGSGGYQDRDRGRGHHQKWNIPRFPESWSQAVGGKFFDVMKDWRSKAHHNQPYVKALNAEFETMSIKVPHPNGGGGGGGGGRGRKRIRRAEKVKEADQPDMDEEDNGDKKPAADDSKYCRRILFRSSRWVITKRNI